MRNVCLKTLIKIGGKSFERKNTSETVQRPVSDVDHFFCVIFVQQYLVLRGTDNKLDHHDSWWWWCCCCCCYCCCCCCCRRCVDPKIKGSFCCSVILAFCVKLLSRLIFFISTKKKMHLACEGLKREEKVLKSCLIESLTDVQTWIIRIRHCVVGCLSASATFPCLITPNESNKVVYPARKSTALELR